MNKFDELKNNFEPFMKEIFTFINELGIDVSNLVIDHCALRFKNPEDVENLYNLMLSEGVLLSQAIVNGRKIYIFKLNNPFKYNNYQISCVELPNPASNHDYPNDGWEHVEFVVPMNRGDNFEEVFKNKFNFSKDILEKYNYLVSIPKAEGEQLPNPTISLTKYKGLSIKFHPYSIEEIVKS